MSGNSAGGAEPRSTHQSISEHHASDGGQWVTVSAAAGLAV